jgi:hypothetical protein
MTMPDSTETYGPIGRAAKEAADLLWQQAQVAQPRIIEMVPPEFREGLRMHYIFGAVDRFQQGPGRMMVKFEHAVYDGWFVILDSDLDDLEASRSFIDECVAAWQDQRRQFETDLNEEVAKRKEAPSYFPTGEPFTRADLNAAVEKLKENEISGPYIVITKPLEFYDEPPRPAAPSGTPYDASRKHFLEVRYPGNGRDDTEMPITFVNNESVRELGNYLLTMADNAETLGGVATELRLQVAIPEWHVLHENQRLRDGLNELACSWVSAALERIPPPAETPLTDEGHRALLHGRRLGLTRAAHELVRKADLPEEHLEELKKL